MSSLGIRNCSTVVFRPALGAIGTLGACLLVGSVASATPIQQPNGTYIPQSPDRTNQPNEASMQQVLDAEEGVGVIDVTTTVDSQYAPTNDPALNDVDVDAATTPETFKPQCDLTFEVFSRGGDSRNSFGWYNVTSSASPPGAAELIEVIECDDPVGFDSGAINFAQHPRWTGGEIAFYITSQATPGGWYNSCPTPAGHGSIFFSEAKYNTGLNDSGYTYVLIVDSKKEADSFYFGWEDNTYDPVYQSADWDFNDLLVRVTGIQCKGAGEPCDTGHFGRCAPGITSCENGELICKQLMPALGESCNAVDDDCNGFVDEGDLCEAGDVCDAGVCKPNCGSGELPCEVGGTVCDPSTGLCVDENCLGIICDAGQLCVEGDCKEACDGVACPYGQLCQIGRCVDPCDGVVCNAGYVCQGGACVLGCQCDKCDDGFTCDDVTTYMCLEDDCADVECAAGQHCIAGVCEDDCSGAVCPEGSECQGGDCVPVASGGTAGTGGTGPIDTGGAAGAGGGGADSNAAGAAAAGTSAGGATFADAPGPAPTSACACDVPRATTRADAAWLALGLVGLMGAIFRRSRRGRHRGV